jgi:hypothetical protein
MSRGEITQYNNGSFLPEEEIQKVIFDKQYLKYLEKKLHGEEPGLPGLGHAPNRDKEKRFF